MKGSYYNCYGLIEVTNQDGKKQMVYTVECPDEWEGRKLMTYKQMKHWEQTGEVQEWKAYTESRAKPCLRQTELTESLLENGV